MDPDQTAPKRSSLIWVHTVCKNDFKNHKQMTKQTTIVVTGALRVNILSSRLNSPIHSYSGMAGISVHDYDIAPFSFLLAIRYSLFFVGIHYENMPIQIH